MKKLRVADINLLIDYRYPTMTKQCEAYLSDFDKPDMTLKIPDAEFARLCAENPQLTEDDIEYIFTGAAFYEALLRFDGFMLHSSGVSVDGYAYLFSADPGTGKSTHTGLWQKYMGEDRAKIINDDKPALRIHNGETWVYGTPWSGKTDKNLNMCVRLGAIVFLERAEKNFIKPISVTEALPMLLKQTLRSPEADKMTLLLDVLDKVLGEAPLYRLGCDMSREAVELSYNTIRRDR